MGSWDGRCYYWRPERVDSQPLEGTLPQTFGKTLLGTSILLMLIFSTISLANCGYIVTTQGLIPALLNLYSVVC